MLPLKSHTNRFLELTRTLQASVQEITVAQLQTRLAAQQPLYLIDVREESEFADGFIPGALPLSKGIIERDIEKYIGDSGAEIVLYCSGGYRSILAAANLSLMGYTNVVSLTGGLRAWLLANQAVQSSLEV